MAPKKKNINFNAYWPFLKDMAHHVKKMNKGKWFAASGLSLSRYTEFDHGKAISAYYFLKLIGGIKLKADEVERLSGKTYTPDQRSELTFYNNVTARRETLTHLFADPEEMERLEKKYHVKK